MKKKDDLTLVDAFDTIQFFASYYKGEEKFLSSVMEALQLLIVPLQWDIMPQKRHSTSIFAEVIRYMPEIQISFALPSLLDYLGRALEAYKRQKVATALVYVKNDVKLASAMFNWYQSEGHGAPQILEQWKDFTLGKEQFSDIANSWKSN